MAEEPGRVRDEELLRQAPAAAAPPPDRQGPSGDGGGGGGGGGGGRGPTAATGLLVPPGFGSPRGRRRGGGGRGAGDSSRPGGGGGGGRGPSRPGRGGMVPPGLGGGGGRGPHGSGGKGRGPGPSGPPPPGSKAEAKMKQEARREERRAALFKRQVASMEVSPTMLLRADLELRESILRGGPDVAPPSSYEELPAAQHCYWADTLLLDQAQLQAPSVAAPGVDHAAAMEAAMRLHEQPPNSTGGNSSSVLLNGTLGDFVIDKSMADLLASV